VDCKRVFALARVARGLIGRRRTLAFACALLVCGVTLPAIAGADADPTKPSASFTFAPDSPATGEAVIFTSTSTPGLLGGAIETEAWDLDNDGNFNDATGSQVETSFPTAGDHTVGLQVTDSNGASEVASATVTVRNRPPAASFSVSPSSPSTLQTITFTSTSTDADGSIASYAWDLDNDGNFNDGTGSVAQHSFPFSGTHTVRLLVTDNNGESDIATKEIEVGNQPPVASFDYSPPSPSTGDKIALSSTATDPDGSIIDYSWDLNGDDEFGDATGAQAEVSFPDPGSHTVRLRVTDDNGASATTDQLIAVANRPPAASFTSSPSLPKTGDEVTLTSTSTDPDDRIASFAWDLNNDNQFDDATGAVAHMSFPSAGSHTIRLKVTDSSGATDIATGTVDVANRDPSPSFTSSPASPKTGDAVTFTSTSTDSDGSIASLAWDLDNDGQFNDGAGEQAQRSFPHPGTYTVRLLAVDNDGGSAVATGTVEIGNRAPTAAFDFSPQDPKTLEPVTFTSTSSDPDGSIASYAWDLNNDGQFDDGTGPQAQATFATPGTHTVRLLVTDNNGESDLATKQIDVGNQPPTASVDHTPKSPQTRAPITFTATAADPEHRVKSLAWDSNNDGKFDDGTGTTLTRSFNKPGAYTVKFRIEDLDGASTVAEDVVAVNNQPPTASFVVLPESPIAGVPATLVSTSLDPDTPLEKWLWDLNGDGQYDDAEGPQIQHTFPAPGTYTVGLRVLDSEEVDNIAVQTVVVQPPPATVTPPLATGSYQLLSPFPIVRLAGRIGRAGTRLRLFSIEAPPGARVLVTCGGRGCPFRHSARSAEAPRDGKVHASASLRIRKLEQRLLKTGVRIAIYVTKAGKIGKYVQFRFRKLRPPTRIDRCLLPSEPNKPVQCPS
jgi:large repetitive protein